MSLSITGQGVLLFRKQRFAMKLINFTYLHVYPILVGISSHLAPNITTGLLHSSSVDSAILNYSCRNCCTGVKSIIKILLCRNENCVSSSQNYSLLRHKKVQYTQRMPKGDVFQSRMSSKKSDD